MLAAAASATGSNETSATKPGTKRSIEAAIFGGVPVSIAT